MFTIGIIGCGKIVEFAHADAFIRLPGEVTVTAIADPSVRRLAAVGEMLRVEPDRRYLDYRAMLAREQLDFVDVAVPPFLHEEVLLCCAKAKVNVIIEKPVACNLEEADRMLEAVEQHGISFSVLHNYRYSPGAAKAVELVRAGRIGTPFLLRSESYTGGYWPGAEGYDPAWRTKRSQAGGGCLLDNGYHSIYLARELMQSPVTSVYARTGTFASDMDVDDTAVLVLNHANGGISSVHVSWAADNVSVNEIHGTKGSISFRPGIMTDKLTEGERKLISVFDKDTGHCEFPETDYGYGNSIAQLMHDCFTCFAQGKSVYSDGEEARRTMEVIAACYESAETGKAVTLPR